MIGLIKAKPKSVKAKGVFNRTPLHWAAIVGSDRCWDILIKYGCSPHEKDSFGRTPLDYIQNNKLNKLHRILKITP
jgi:ankyrin repeat protein